MTRARWLSLAALTLFAAGLWVGAGAWLRRGAAARLPSLPDLEGRPAPLAAQLHGAFDAARAAPDSAEAVGELGMTLHSNGFLRRALDCYRLAGELDPEGWRWEHHQGLIHQARGQAGAAAAAFTRVTGRSPERAYAWYWLAEARFKLGDTEKAREAYRRARRLAPRPVRGFPLLAYAALGLARIELGAGRREEGAKFLREAVSKAPRLGTVQRLLAQVYEEMGEPERGQWHRDIAKNCTRYVPPFDPLVEELANRSLSSTVLLKHMALAEYAGEAEWATFLGRRAVLADPHDLDAAVALARNLRIRGRPEEGVPVLLPHRTRNPDDPDTAGELARCLEQAVAELARTGHSKEAEALLLRVLEKAPGDGYVHGLLGDLHFRAGLIPRAVAELRQALDYKESPEIRTRLGTALAASGNLPAAIGEFRTVLQASGDFVPALVAMAMARAQTGDLAEARRLCREALRADPESRAAQALLDKLE